MEFIKSTYLSDRPATTKHPGEPAPLTAGQPQPPTCTAGKSKQESLNQASETS